MSMFSNVSVTLTVYGEQLIHWRMCNSFKPTEPVDFYVDRARAGGDWENVGGPITNACFYIDSAKLNWNMDRNTFYRVRFRHKQEWVYSIPAQAGCGLEHVDWTLVKEICRKERVLYRTAGLNGYLLKRKEWGVPCPRCLDHDTREVSDGMCPRCFGTSIDGGYYFGIPMQVLLQQAGPRKKGISQDIGTTDPSRRFVRSVHYPMICAKDLWISASNADRYEVGVVNIVTFVREMPVIGVYEFKMLPRTSIAYSDQVSAKAVTLPVEQPTGTAHTWHEKLDCD